MCTYYVDCRQDSSVGIAMDYGMNGPSSIPIRQDLIFRTASKPAVEPIQSLSNGYQRQFRRG
jgi:hypothetical protein